MTDRGDALGFKAARGILSGMARLLLAEDDELLSDALSTLLQQAGHEVTAVADGQAALERALDRTPAPALEGLVLDLGLPRLDGLQVLTALRQQHPTLPVLILTARDAVESRIAGLQAGADDYLTKPFNPQELLVRVQSMLRRSRLPAFAPAQASAADPEAHPGDIQMDASTLRATVASTVIDLTPREWGLLDLLVRQSGQVVSREAVMDMWQAQPLEGSGNALASNALEVYVHRLRRKLAGTGYTLRNIRGLGYLLEQGAG
jgi:DNA-binding response OmpR family regulator